MYLQNYLLFNLQIILLDALVGENVRSAEEMEFPFIVAITKSYHSKSLNKQKYNICAGSLISRKDVLTSEHCLASERIKRITVIAESSYLDAGKKYYPKWWITFDQWAHKNYYATNNSNNDIAIVNLILKVPDYIKPVYIFLGSEKNLHGMQIKTAGWGTFLNHSSPNALQVGIVNVLSKEECKDTASRFSKKKIKEDIRVVCTLANPFVILRPGDSGGPLFFNNLLIGVNYGTIPFRVLNFHPDQVNLHMNASYYYDFISNEREYI